MTDLRIPGADLVQQGLQDLLAGRETVAALVVAIGAPRLRRMGIAVPEDNQLPERPEHRLYARLAREDERSAHAGYNALIRRLVSHERALELAHYARSVRGVVAPPSDTRR